MPASGRTAREREAGAELEKRNHATFRKSLVHFLRSLSEILIYKNESMSVCVYVHYANPHACTNLDQTRYSVVLGPGAGF